jgi:hypothetical protein
MEAASRWSEQRRVQFGDSSRRIASLMDDSGSMATWACGGASRVLGRCGGPSGCSGGGARKGQSSGIRVGEGEGNNVDLAFSSCPGRRLGQRRKGGWGRYCER